MSIQMPLPGACIRPILNLENNNPVKFWNALLLSIHTIIEVNGLEDKLLVVDRDEQAEASQQTGSAGRWWLE